jgi:phage shock protein E
MATVLDVRTEIEFISGHADGAVNIPLHLLPLKLDEIKKMKSPIVVCCAAGARSYSACGLLFDNGIRELYDAGAWQNATSVIAKLRS